ncbi:endocuticle structural protein SgAbd-6-like [Teleopsis dalmanni]|uniref:endocuticle structural protein SgAbd-6-like n=1 Tax=Teleopsis dalmanni TaxID=139649 RepID=UPI0018CCA32E|nr:endocuticle structural protein SgAbd-6-like [Teleopsis dalmanni]
MKLLHCLTLIAVIAAVLAAPQGDTEILENSVENIGIGGYSFSYKLSDGTTRTEEAVLNNAGTDKESISITGKVTWVAPDGQTYTLTFVADENGFQPEGAHIPK